MVNQQFSKKTLRPFKMEEQAKHETPNSKAVHIDGKHVSKQECFFSQQLFRSIQMHKWLQTEIALVEMFQKPTGNLHFMVTLESYRAFVPSLRLLLEIIDQYHITKFDGTRLYIPHYAPASKTEGV